MASENQETQNFHVADYIVFAACLLLCTAIGLVYGCVGMRKKKSAKEQLTGGKTMKAIPVSLSILASFQAAPFVLGTPAEMYVFGTMYIMILAGCFIAIPLTAHVFIPVYHRLDLINGYQYFEQRFNKATRLMCSGIFCFMTLMYQAVVVYAPALAFSQVTGLSQTVTILAVGLIATFYTAIGGLAAVIWIDVLQMAIILGGLIIMAILGSIEVGGWSKVMDTAEHGGRIEFDNFDPNPTTRHTFWSQSIGGAFLIMAVLASNQATIQKYLSIGKVKEAKKTPYIVWIAFVVYLFLVCFLGLTMYTHYYGCDPISLGRVEQNDQLILLFMMEVMGHLHGIPGLFTSAVFCASLSTVSAGINALAAVTMMDFIKPLYIKRSGRQDFNERLALILSKSLTVMYGLLTIGFAYLAPLLGDTLLQIAYSIFGTMGGPLLGLMMLGFFFPFANTVGAIAGLLSSLIIGLWISVAAIAQGVVKDQAKKFILVLSVDTCPSGGNGTAYNSTDSWMTPTDSLATSGMWTTVDTSAGDDGDSTLAIYKISYMWYAFISVVICLLVGCVVSLLTGGLKQRVDPKLLVLPQCCLREETSYEIEKQTKEPIDFSASFRGLGEKSEPMNGYTNQAFTSSNDIGSTVF